jgi:hypothetical protein
MLSLNANRLGYEIRNVAMDDCWFSGQNFSKNYLKLKTVYMSFRVCLDRAKNNVRIKKLKIISEDSEKIVIFR